MLTERLIKQGFCYSKLCKFFKQFVSRHNALFSKCGVSVRTHVHEGICILLVIKHEYLNILLQVEGIVLNYIIHACMPVAALVNFAIFPTKTMCKVCCSVFVCCVNSRWSTWVVRVGAPRKIFKPHSQISRLGMWTICFAI